MARTVSVQELIDSFRSRGDFENDPHKGDSEIMTWLSASYAELYDILVSSGLAYFEAKDDFITDGTTEIISLPADFYGTLRLDYIFSAEVSWPVREISPRRLHRVTATGQRAYYYRNVASNMILYPRPPTAQTYRHLYIPAPAKLTDPGQVIDGVSGWEDFVTVGAVIRGLGKSQENEMLGAFQMERQRLESRITQAAQNRAIASATSLVEETGDFYDGDWERDPANWRQY